MLTLKIDNPTVENIFLDGFDRSQKDTEYQQNRATISRQVDAYRDRTAKLLTEEESSVIMNAFMKDLKTKHAHPQR